MSDAVPQSAPIIDTTAQVEREQVRLSFGTWVRYFDGLPFALGFAFAMSGVWPSIGDTPVWQCVAWAVLPVLWAVGSYTGFRYYKTHESEHPPAVWTMLQTAIYGANAAVWGLFVWVFWEPGNTGNQAILCTVTLAVIVSAFFQLAAHRRVLLVSMSVHWMLGWAAFLHYDGPVANAFAIAFPLFMVVIMNYSREASAKYVEALRLRFENEALAAAVMRANKAKSDFLASMSHELRTPLNAIIGYSDLMRQGTFGPVMPVRYGEFVDNIAESGAHLLRMINDLLDLAKIESGRRELTIAPVRLSELAKDAVRYVEPQATRAHVSLMLDVKHDAIVRADERAVKQMIINLLSNAVKFSNAGGLAIVFCDVLPGERAAFGVKDTGTGMTAEMQKKALEPFGQASDKMTVEGHGTGLGLPIIKGLIEAHQGQLRIESTPGIGSKIWVEFPAERLLRRAEAA